MRFLGSWKGSSLPCPLNTCLHITLWGLSASAALSSGVRSTGLQILQKTFSSCLFLTVSQASLSRQGLHPHDLQKDSNQGITESQDQVVLFLPCVWAEIPPICTAALPSALLGEAKRSCLHVVHRSTPCGTSETYAASSAIHPQGISGTQTICPHLYMDIKSVAIFFVYLCLKNNLRAKANWVPRKKLDRETSERRMIWRLLFTWKSNFALLFGWPRKIFEVLGLQRQQKPGPVPALFTQSAAIRSLLWGEIKMTFTLIKT